MAAMATKREILDELGRFQKENSQSVGIEAIVSTIADESDRGMVVIVGSITEDALLDRVLSVMPGATKAHTKTMTRAGGLLATWADRTNMALALGIIDEEDAEQLEILKTMRNACAHSRRHITLRTPALRDALSLMFDGETPEQVRATEDPILLRALFMLGASYIWGRIRGQTKETSGARVRKMFEDMRDEVIARAASPETPTQQGLPGPDEAPSPTGQ